VTHVWLLSALDGSDLIRRKKPELPLASFLPNDEYHVALREKEKMIGVRDFDHLAIDHVQNEWSKGLGSPNLPEIVLGHAENLSRLIGQRQGNKDQVRSDRSVLKS
jgi:hypothetical protein